MGIWEWIGSTAETVKRNAPDATSVKNTCTNGGAALSNKVDGLYRVGGKLMPDGETKSKIGTYAAIFGKNAAHYAIEEGYKLIPGGAAFSKIVSKTLDDVKHENLKLKKAEVSAGQAEKHATGAVGSIPDNGHGLAAGKSPEDVISFVNRFLDGVMVSEIARKEGKKPE